MQDECLGTEYEPKELKELKESAIFTLIGAIKKTQSAIDLEIEELNGKTQCILSDWNQEEAKGRDTRPVGCELENVLVELLDRQNNIRENLDTLKNRIQL